MTDAVPHITPLKDTTVSEVLHDVATEIYRQDTLARAGKFGGTHILPGGPDSDRMIVLIEEVGEVAKELNEIRAGQETPGRKYEELIQTAASAVAWATAHLEELEGYR